MNNKTDDYKFQQESAYQPEGQRIETSENHEYLANLQGLEKAMTTNKILEARAVLCDIHQNLTVDLNGIKGIIEREEACIGSYSDGNIRDIAIIKRVGKTVCFKILRIENDNDGEPVVYLSRKAAQEECLDNYIMKLTCGDIIDAKVTHIEPFGCFCDIGCGVISLLSIEDVSISRLPHPNERFVINQKIKTVIKDIDYETKKVSLSHKELLGTWEENASKFQIGQTVTGIVRSVEQYGIFIEITPNLAGLAEYRDGVSEGQHATVYIKNIVSERMKIKFVLIDTYDTPKETPPKPRYYIKNGHINIWRYSPSNCDKIIETVFNDETIIKI